MLSRDTTPKNFRSAMLGEAFSADELERLMSLRKGLTEHMEHHEFLINQDDLALLEFGRWLYEHGRIAEDPAR